MRDELHAGGHEGGGTAHSAATTTTAAATAARHWSATVGRPCGDAQDVGAVAATIFSAAENAASPAGLSSGRLAADAPVRLLGVDAE